MASCSAQSHDSLSDGYKLYTLNKVGQVELGNSPFLGKGKLVSQHVESNEVVISFTNHDKGQIEVWRISPSVDFLKSYDCNLFKSQYISDYHILESDTLIVSFIPSSVKGNHNQVVLKVFDGRIVDTCDFSGLPITASSNPDLRRKNSVYIFPYYFPMLISDNKVFSSFLPYSFDSTDWVLENHVSFIYEINFVGNGSTIKPLEASFMWDSILNVMAILPHSYSWLNGGFILGDKLFYGYGFSDRIYGVNLKNRKAEMIIDAPLPIDDIAFTSQILGLSHNDLYSEKLFQFGQFVLNTDSTEIIRLNRLPVEKDNVFEGNYPIHMLQIIPLDEKSRERGIAFVPSGYTDHILIPIENGVILYNKLESHKRGKIVLDIFQLKEEQQFRDFHTELRKFRTLSAKSTDSKLTLKEYLCQQTGLKSLSRKTIILVNEKNACGPCVTELRDYLQKGWLCKQDKIFVSFISNNDSELNDSLNECSVFNSNQFDIENMLLPWTNILRIDFDENEEVVHRQIYSASTLQDLKYFISIGDK